MLADFDGDGKLDVVTSGPGRPDGDGFAHEVIVQLSASEPSSFAFGSRYRSVQLNSRDVDGDHDRDIIIREAGSSEPVAVWLNDGSGHFLRGDLERFRAAWG